MAGTPKSVQAPASAKKPLFVATLGSSQVTEAALPSHDALPNLYRRLGT